MPLRLRFLPTSLVAVLLCAISTTPAFGQSPWLPRDAPRGILVEFLRPHVEWGDPGFLSPGIFVSGRLAVSSHIAIVGELPYARSELAQIRTDSDGNRISDDPSSSTVGNVYLGVEAAQSAGPLFGELGIRLPLVSEDEYLAGFTGIVSDVTRSDAFYPNTFTVQAAFNVREVSSSNVEYRVRLSPVLSIATEGSEETELFGVYSWEVGYRGKNIRVGTAISGRILITEDYRNLGERSLNEFQFHADVGSWALRPGFDLHLPLDSWGSLVPVVLGASLRWSR